MIAQTIVRHFPSHNIYLEPFFGSGACLFTKKTSPIETVNDLDGEVVNLFRIIREQPDELVRVIEATPWARDEYKHAIQHRDTTTDPLERARLFLVRSWQAIGVRHGTTAWTGGWRTSTQYFRHAPASTWARLPDRIRYACQRLRFVQIENRPALDVISRYASQDCLIYADPPYIRSSRASTGQIYTHEMTDQDHEILLDTLEIHPGPVLISGYTSRLYSERLRHWKQIVLNGRSQVREAVDNTVFSSQR